jgi:hypothetical protein
LVFFIGFCQPNVFTPDHAKKLPRFQLGIFSDLQAAAMTGGPLLRRPPVSCYNRRSAIQPAAVEEVRGRLPVALTGDLRFSLLL